MLPPYPLVPHDEDFCLLRHWMFLPPSLSWCSSPGEAVLLASLSMLLLRMSSQSICAIRLKRSATQWAVSRASGSWSQHSVMVSHRKRIPCSQKGWNQDQKAERRGSNTVSVDYHTSDILLHKGCFWPSLSTRGSSLGKLWKCWCFHWHCLC